MVSNASSAVLSRMCLTFAQKIAIIDLAEVSSHSILLVAPKLAEWAIKEVQLASPLLRSTVLKILAVRAKVLKTSNLECGRK